MRVLVTRPLEEARRTAAELSRRGHEALVAPLSEIRSLETDEQNLVNVQAILATSSNGVRAFASRCARRDIRLLAVGEKTAATARSAGFADVSSADGDAGALGAMVRHSLDPAAGALLHVTGKNRGAALHRELSEAGFECRAWELYDVAARDLPDEVIAAFQRNTIDAILVLSPESGRILDKALRAGGVAGNCNHVMACCISRPAAAAVQAVGFGAVRVADSPTLDAVLSLLDAGSGDASTAPA